MALPEVQQLYTRSFQAKASPYNKTWLLLTTPQAEWSKLKKTKQDGCEKTKQNITPIPRNALISNARGTFTMRGPHAHQPPHKKGRSVVPCNTHTQERRGCPHHNIVACPPKPTQTTTVRSSQKNQHTTSPCGAYPIKPCKTF